MSRARRDGFAGPVARRAQPPAAPRAAADLLRALRGACLAGCVALAVLFGSAQDARAADDASWGYALANELMSPWCPGFALPDCASGYASDLRLWILEQERLGRSEDDVKAEILARYGEKMLQAPKAEGRGWLAYLIPAAIILGGLAVLVTFLRAQQRAPASAGRVETGIAALALDPLLLTQVDRELASYQAGGDANHGAGSGSDSDAGGGSDSGGSDVGGGGDSGGNSDSDSGSGASSDS